MNTRVNFEDNIFILNTRIRMIHNMLLLDADPELFLERTLEDLAFINAALERLLAGLQANTRYIEREEQLHNLSETESAFMEILSSVLDGDGMISAGQFPVIRDRVGLFLAKSGGRKKDIDSRNAGFSSAPEPLVSPDEMSELLRDME